MRKIDQRTGLLSARRSLVFTDAVATASDRHPREARAVQQQLTRWDSVWNTRREAEDEVVRGNARVAWADQVLDAAVARFANELLRDLGGKATHPDFRAFFPEAPSEVIRQGLQSQIERCAALEVVAGKRKISSRASTALREVVAAMAAGRAALEARQRAFVKRAEVALDAQAWRESADAVRQSVHVNLQSWALANGESRKYADRFFPEHRGARSGADEGSDDDESDTPTPDPAPKA